MTPMISEAKMKVAADMLMQIVQITQKYDELFKTMSFQERFLAGGIIFRIRNPWSEFNIVGIMSDKDLAREMLDTLVLFYQHPESFAGKEGRGPLIIPAKKKDELKN